jgi:hypothetical protein
MHNSNTSIHLKSQNRDPTYPIRTINASHTLKLIFSQNLRNLHTEARVGLSLPIPILRFLRPLSPSTSKLNRLARTLTLTLSSSHSTPKNRTSSGLGRCAILTSSEFRYISRSRDCERDTSAGATVVDGKTCRLTKSDCVGRRSSLRRR